MSSSSMLPPVGPVGHVYPRRRRQSSSSSSSSSSRQCSWTRPRPKPRGGSRGYSTDDEDEVLYDLDEAALAQLPVHLQDTMRELQLERVHRFQQQQQQQQQSAHNELQLCRPVYHSDYAETWFKNMMARLSADQEMSEAHYHLRQAQGNTYQQDESWRSQQQQWSVNRQNDIQAAAAAAAAVAMGGNRNIPALS
ncbi:hypothetical protein ASPACDRAFT_56401 [Aspergillus aculeatus ATCC 16872]|uniref:Uncharacterized protein n=1 Tax=Aspergillus aculeatus (strain ATCC 16872 / CBS 172.66 / WB 5094) TaxID=690307 RepID=A0A1L9X9G4_ASPA1|nr:uncharacterized protein ASPACDRAFT_56401 [Aspergillus aculeatus ATCC 16872]OJK04998.1 hypothetical protein ASPACDRAFT_56401 [Aspergillus aculeatus ATCC 16872]